MASHAGSNVLAMTPIINPFPFPNRHPHEHKTFRLHLYSGHLLRGTWNNATFKIDLPYWLYTSEMKYQIAAEYFGVQDNILNPFAVSASVPQDNQFNSAEGGPASSAILLVSRKENNWMRSVQHDTVGAPIRDPSFLRSDTLTIKITKWDGTLAPAPSVLGDTTYFQGQALTWDSNGVATSWALPQWMLTLVIYPRL